MLKTCIQCLCPFIAAEFKIAHLLFDNYVKLLGPIFSVICGIAGQLLYVLTPAH